MIRYMPGLHPQYSFLYRKNLRLPSCTKNLAETVLSNQWMSAGSGCKSLSLTTMPITCKNLKDSKPSIHPTKLPSP